MSYSFLSTTKYPIFLSTPPKQVGAATCPLTFNGVPAKAHIFSSVGCRDSPSVAQIVSDSMLAAAPESIKNSRVSVSAGPVSRPLRKALVGWALTTATSPPFPVRNRSALGSRDSEIELSKDVPSSSCAISPIRAVRCFSSASSEQVDTGVDGTREAGRDAVRCNGGDEISITIFSHVNIL